MWLTIIGKTVLSRSGSEIVPPRLTESITSPITRATTSLPALRPVMSSASSSGTPAAVRAENVRAQRAIEIFWTMSPILNGIFRRSASHWGRPVGERFQRVKLRMIANAPPMKAYQ